MIIEGRIEKLRHKLAEAKLDAILVSQRENRRYLSGFTGSAGFLLISEGRAILATDSRYVEQAQDQAPDFEVFRAEGELRNWFPELASSLGAKKLAFEASNLPFSAY